MVRIEIIYNNNNNDNESSKKKFNIFELIKLNIIIINIIIIINSLEKHYLIKKDNYALIFVSIK